MYYIERNETEVVKYKIQLHERGINEVRDRLIKDYSSVIKVNNYLCFSNINKFETDRIKDFSNNFNRVNFNYYIYPELVIYIDMLLNNNVVAIEKIINYEKKDLKFNKLLNNNYIIKICNDISNQLNISFNSNDLEYYINNNFCINDEDYMFLKEELLKCISFEKIDSVSINDFYKMMDFLNLDKIEVLNNSNNRVKKKTKKVSN